MILGFASSAYAAKLYKIIDKETGKVTYSQYPPAEPNINQNATIEGVNVASGGGTTRLVSDGFGQRCGSIELPNKDQLSYRNSSTGNLRYSKMVKESLDRWQSELNRLGERTAERSRNKSEYQNRANQYKSSKSYQAQRDKRYNEEKQNDAGKMRDLRCAISWANNNEETNSGVAESRLVERDRLANIVEKQEQAMALRCGTLPKYDPSNRITEAKRMDWFHCSKKYRSDIKNLKSKMRRITH